MKTERIATDLCSKERKREREEERWRERVGTVLNSPIANLSSALMFKLKTTGALNPAQKSRQSVLLHICSTKPVFDSGGYEGRSTSLTRFGESVDVGSVRVVDRPHGVVLGQLHDINRCPRCSDEHAKHFVGTVQLQKSTYRRVDKVNYSKPEMRRVVRRTLLRAVQYRRRGDC